MTGGDDVAQQVEHDAPGTYIGHRGFDPINKLGYSDYFDWDRRTMQRWYDGARGGREIPSDPGYSSPSRDKKKT